MLAAEFKDMFSDVYKLFLTDYQDLDITDIGSIDAFLWENNINIILNFAAYTAVDEAEDIGSKMNYDVNALWVYNLAKISKKYDVDFITISSDYVFSWDVECWYHENDSRKPLNAYGMAKYIGESLSLQENKNSIIVRTSWLYWGGKDYKNFVNTMIELWNKLDSLKVIDDQLWNPTYALDLSKALWEVIEDIITYRWHILHFSNSTENNGISWYEFAQEIFKIKEIKIDLKACTTNEFPTKAKRPSYSKLHNNCDIQLRNWKEGLKAYLSNT